MKNNLIVPIINIDIQLIACDDIVRDSINKPNIKRPSNQPFSKLIVNDYIKVRDKANSILNDDLELDRLLMHTYYGSNIIFGIAVLNEPTCEEIQKGNFIYSF